MDPQINKAKRQRLPVVPEHRHEKNRVDWFSAGPAIILISIVVATVLGFWLIVL